MNQLEIGIWEERANQAQAALDSFFWNEAIKMYNIETPCPNGECNTIFHYWWIPCCGCIGRWTTADWRELVCQKAFRTS